jgi:hypothetical protein
MLCVGELCVSVMCVVCVVCMYGCVLGYGVYVWFCACMVVWLCFVTDDCTHVFQ